MRSGTQNFYSSELSNMEKHPAEKAKETGRRPPYHLQYIREGKPNIKPKNEASK